MSVYKNLRQLESCRGSVSILFLLLIPLLFLFVAFVFDTGRLLVNKANGRQIADIAVLSAVGHLSESQGDIVDSIQTVLHENNVSFDGVKYFVGYYDQYDIFDDFSTYKNFASDNEIPDDFFPNAVLVEGLKKVSTIALNNGTDKKQTVCVESIGYLRQYDIVAVGQNGIVVKNKWDNGYPKFVNCCLYSEADISFLGSETIDEMSTVFAAGKINNFAEGQENARPIQIKPIDWEIMRDQADMLYYPEQWGISSTGPDMHGNQFVKFNNIYYFLPKEGDHGGKKYYFVNSSKTKLPIYINSVRFGVGQSRHSYNFSIMYEGDIFIKPESQFDEYLELGKPETGIVYIYSAGNIFIQDRYRNHAATFVSNGVVFYCEETCTVIAECGNNQDPAYHRMRIIADNIVFNPDSWRPKNKIIIDSMFGPPCPPLIKALAYPERNKQ